MSPAAKGYKKLTVMQVRSLIRILGLLIAIFSSTLLLPAMVAAIYKDGGGLAFVQSFFSCLVLGLMLWYPNRKEFQELKVRDGFVVVAMFWIVLGSVGSVPFLLSERPDLSLADSVFESFSALTTTGATVITGLDDLPKAILFYRHLLQWLGGMGIIVLAVAVLPMLGVGGMQLYRAETPGPVKDSKMTPRIAETAKALWYIYLALTLACALAYWLAGMTPFDAIGHSFSTIAIGGFSSHDASMGYFNSPLLNLICVFFLLVSAINFSLHFAAFSKRGFKVSTYLQDPEFRMFIGFQIVMVLIVFGVLYKENIYATNEEALNHALFQAVSVSTTAGFGTDSFSGWPLFCRCC